MFDWWKRMTHKHHETDNELLRDIKELLIQLVRQGKPHQNDKLTLSIGGTSMGAPAQLVLGQPPVQSVVTESLAGVTKPLTGPITFASDNPAVATVDSNGLVTSVALGTANVTATDSTNVPALSDTVAVTVVAPGPPPPAQNDALQLSIPSQTP